MTNVYQRPANVSLTSSKTNTTGPSLLLPCSKKSIALRETHIKSDEVLSKVFKSDYNARCMDLMTPFTVANILGSIRRDGTNTVPVLAVKHADGRFEILSGMKRSYAVSISPGTRLTIHFAHEQDFTDQDKAELAKTFDEHEKPSFLDRALSMSQYQEKHGNTMNIRDIASVFGVSKSSVSEDLRIAKLPMSMFRLFPAAQFIKKSFLRAVLKFELANDQIEDVISSLEPLPKEAVDGDDFFSKATELKVAKLSNDVLKCLAEKVQKNASKKQPTTHVLNGVQLKQGVVAKATTKGGLTLTLSKKFVESDEFQKVLEMVKS